MKRFSKLFCIMLFAITAASLASCLGSDDDGGIDPATYKAWLTSISGNYYGNDGSWTTENKIYFYNDTITGDNKTDSITGVDVSFYGDSTVVVNNVPGRLLAKAIKNNDALKEAIENTYSQTLKAKFIFYDIQNPYASYFVYPAEVTYRSLAYNGENHDVTVKFYSPSAGAFLIDSGTRKVSLSFCVEGVYVDGSAVPSIYDDLSSNEKQGRALFQVYATR